MLGEGHVNGQPIHNNSYLISILKKQYRFAGVVVSSFHGLSSIPSQSLQVQVRLWGVLVCVCVLAKNTVLLVCLRHLRAKHRGWAPEMNNTARLKTLLASLRPPRVRQVYGHVQVETVVNAGVDLILAPPGQHVAVLRALKQGLRSGAIRQERVNDAVRRVLRAKELSAHFDSPCAPVIREPEPHNSSNNEEGKETAGPGSLPAPGGKAHRQLARQYVACFSPLLAYSRPSSASSRPVWVVGASLLLSSACELRPFTI